MDLFEKITLLEKEAADFGFKWETSGQIISQIKSEITEVEVHLKDGDKDKLQGEIGDLLHAVCSLCIFNQFDPEQVLLQSTHKFESRFKAVKQLAADKGLTNLHEYSFEELMHLWNQAKKLVKK